MKKIGLLCMALVLALGSLGIGYASWTDTITIDGTVNTGSVDLNVVELSSTLVYKDLGNDGVVVVHQRENLRPPVPGTIGWHIVNVPPIPSNGLLVASAVATSPAEDTVTITYWNLFPSIDFVADILLHYEGSIPVKISVADFTPTGDQGLLDLWAAGKPAAGQPGAWIDWYESDANGAKGALILDPHGIQLHECDYILVEGHIHLPQDNALMNKSGSFTATFEVIQWNEYNNEPQ